ncbi:Holliday junction resolvase [Candidatus Woesearchaeota archaeon CG10_big_fil_rev_8_21_14_0_10_45_16]|nr:MAG: Holliday junction resolvase [Candidatus Woesearchaeota archaeon CG10_big_fil_rev_8_21_14_0_10_45_16]
MPGINRKAKGTKGERDLIRFFNEAGWSAIRSAGSGSSRYPSPDILAANAIRRLAIECKVTKDGKKYFQNAEIEQLLTFSRKFGAESWIGVKFPNDPWYFIMPEDLEETGVCKAVSVELAKRRGLTFQELMGRD